MATTNKAKVFMSGRSQAVRIPLEYRFDTKEVSIRRDPHTGDVILSQPEKKKPTKKDWKEIFAMFDAAEIPEDFMADRKDTFAEEREEL